MRRGGIQLSCRQVGMAQLCPDRCSPQSIRLVLRERRGEFKKLECLSGLAERFSHSGRGDEGLALLMGLSLCFVLPRGFFPFSQGVFVRATLKSLCPLCHHLIGWGAWSG